MQVVSMIGVEAEKEFSGNFQVRMGPARKTRWSKTCDARKIAENTAINALVDWWLDQDAVTQAMILGQLPPRPDLIELVLRNLAPPARTTGNLTGATVNKTGATPKR